MGCRSRRLSLDSIAWDGTVRSRWLKECHRGGRSSSHMYGSSMSFVTHIRRHGMSVGKLSLNVLTTGLSSVPPSTPWRCSHMTVRRCCARDQDRHALRPSSEGSDPYVAAGEALVLAKTSSARESTLVLSTGLLNSIDTARAYYCWMTVHCWIAVTSLPNQDCPARHRARRRQSLADRRPRQGIRPPPGQTQSRLVVMPAQSRQMSCPAAERPGSSRWAPQNAH
jgi:hypothetical protein